jgi:plasmid maintenance system antidote protein VapI
MHPLQEALDKGGITQRKLADMVTALRWKRGNGQPLRLKQNSISQICAFKRRVTPDVAKAIEHVLGGRISAATLVLVRRPRGSRDAA